MSEREKIYECEVKRRRQRASGKGYEPFWKIKSVQDAAEDGDTEFRCKDCHGAVKLHVRRTAGGAASHVEHKSKQDSEYCSASMCFQVATDGRVARLSGAPVA
jgi:hypothetical protein